jgi:hypothetical protein
LGVSILSAPNASIHTRFAGESDPAVITVENAERVSPAVFVHFPIPPRDAWRNVIHWCATVLPFRSADDAAAWNQRHGLGLGELVPIGQVLQLARAWYGKHLAPDWRKWSMAEAQGIFDRVGLTGPHWRLSASSERF